MVVTRLKVFNLALQMLEKNPISDLGVADLVVDKLKSVEEIAQKTLLASGEFDFARADVQLAYIGPLTIGRYRKQFALPADCLEVVYAYKEALSSNIDENTEPIEYELQDGVLLCNEETVYVKYTKDVTDYSKYDWSFAEALAGKMASLCGLSVNHSTGRTGFIGDNAIRSHGAALNRSIGKSQGRYIRQTNWLQARNFRRGING
jgi:hypothetical protein